ncbi:MAG TPA: class I SAM-dependent methyltransferase [Vicinamibacterales bacterium]|nr:class I SAM-dependent methyltransferase [Vicinamibacterales bacterium]
MTVGRRVHWERIYATRREGDVSWFEAAPAVSLEMLDAAGVTRESCVLDVGGGDSRLVDYLVVRGLTCLAVLDVSRAALDRARARLGAAAETVAWIEADVTGDWSLNPVDVWHDRAVFHFLTDPADRARYLSKLREVLKVNGAAVIATFAPDGPERCSGLPVVRYSPESLAAEIGPGFRLVESRRHLHVTPAGVAQAFQYSRFVRLS